MKCNKENKIDYIEDIGSGDSIDKVLFNDSTDVCRQCEIVCALTKFITGVFRFGEEAVQNIVGVVPG